MYLAILNDGIPASDGLIFDAKEQVIDFIARCEIDPIQVAEVNLAERTSRDISEDIATDAWEILRQKFDPDTDTAPEFIERNVPSFYDTLDEMKAERAYPRMEQREMV